MRKRRRGVERRGEGKENYLKERLFWGRDGPP